MLRWLISLFRPRWKPEDWIIRAGERELFRLEYAGWTENAIWLQYRVVYSEGTAELLQRSLGLACDPAELDWILIDSATQREFPIGHFEIIADKDCVHVQLKYLGPS